MCASVTRELVHCNAPALPLCHGALAGTTKHNTCTHSHLDWHHLFTFYLGKCTQMECALLLHTTTTPHTVRCILYWVCVCQLRLDGNISVVFDAIFLALFVFSRSLRFFWCARAPSTRHKSNVIWICSVQSRDEHSKPGAKKRFERRNFIAHFWSLLMLCVCVP